MFTIYSQDQHSHAVEKVNRYRKEMATEGVFRRLRRALRDVRG